MTDEALIWAYVLNHKKIPVAAARAAKLSPSQQDWADAVSFGQLCFHDYLVAVGLPLTLTAKQEQSLNSKAINRIKNRLTNEFHHLWRQQDVAKQAIAEPTFAGTYQEAQAPAFVGTTEQLDLWQQFIRDSQATPRQQIIMALRDLEYSPTAIAWQLGIARQTVYRDLTALQTAYLVFAPRHGLRLPRN